MFVKVWFTFVLAGRIGSDAFMSMMMNMRGSDQASVTDSARSLKLFRHTPLIRSTRLSELSGRDVFLKMDSQQASGSFKDRGMAYLCHTLQAEHGTRKLISSSGGNAGLAAATVGRALGMDVMVIVPETTKPLVIDKLRSLGATVQVHGENWNAADLLARELVEKDPSAAYISPYDNPLLWTGHSTIIDEVWRDLTPAVPAAIIASVGGGGLLCGILEGLQRNHNNNTPISTTVIAAETEGAASFGTSFAQGTIVRLDKIDSIATSLGALQVTSEALERAWQHQRITGSPSMFRTAICSDAEAVDACVQFAADHGVLVEPACGAALAVLYSGRLRDIAIRDLPHQGPVVIEVCGGSGVNDELLDSWKKQFLEKI